MSLSGPPSIPDRTFSKRSLEQNIESDLDQKKSLEKEIQNRRKKIKVKGSFDATYWVDHKKVAGLELKRHELVRKISVNQFLKEGGEEKDWDGKEKAITLREEETALKIKNRVLEEHIARMTFAHTDSEKVHRKWVMEMLTSMPTHKGGLGMGNTVGQGQRENFVQSSFRSRLEAVYSSKHPDEAFDQQWCPIIGSWIHEDLIRAAHIFPCSAGQTAMDEIFGRDAADREEMFEPENGLIICSDAEKRIANGCMIFVPNVPEDATAAVLDEWTNAKVKEYKVRILRPEDQSMRKALPSSRADTEAENPPRHWYQLDGQRVNFRSDFRPRARYLYWQFAVSLLRNALQTQHREGNPITKEFGKRFWGTRGRWIKQRHLLGFTKYLGHGVKWENLMEAAIDPGNDDDRKPDPGGVLVACGQLGEVRRRAAKGWKDDLKGSDEEEEDDEDDEDSN